MNSIVISGRLVDDPELKVTGNGIPVMNLVLVVKRPRVAGVTDFLPVTLWRQCAEFLAKHAVRGTKVSILGVLATRKYEADGKTRTVYEVLGTEAEIDGFGRKSVQEDSGGMGEDSGGMGLPF